MLNNHVMHILVHDVSCKCKGRYVLQLRIILFYCCEYSLIPAFYVSVIYKQPVPKNGTGY